MDSKLYQINKTSGIYMQPINTITSRIIPLPRNDIDTDQIIPARYLKVTDRSGLADGLFYGWRYLADGKPDASFPLNRPEYQGAEIILAGDNFGCGSSREHAPWALTGWGIRAVISTSFADIFRSNALKNGLLTVVVDAETQRRLFELAAAEPTAQAHINLETQTLSIPDGSRVSFDIDSFNKTCLLEGLDQLGYILRFETEIAAYERAAQPMEGALTR
jgi:3-isopropylmalate/(R)-2-methylmalate dehydratase small subunit